jgi:hypothetical protein
MTKQTKTTAKGTHRPMKPPRQSLANGPDHLFRIPLLSFRAELEHLAPNETWFKLGEWSHGYETDKDGLQLTVMRQTLLVPIGSLEGAFDHLDSVGNVLSSLGRSGGAVVLSGAVHQYRYEPFHRFEIRGIDQPCEPLVFVRDGSSKCLFLNPDVIISLSLVEKISGSGVWWDTRTSSEAIKHCVSDKNIESIQIRSDYLRRYLRARQMSLLVGHYAHRHLYNPSDKDIASFTEGEVILGSPKEHAKALFQNWGLRKDIGEAFLQRRLHLWFEISPEPINEHDPWGEEPPFNLYTFTLPTRNGPVAPGKWKHFSSRDGNKRFKGKSCNFMDRIYFRQEALVRYETSADYSVSDDGGVHCGSHWGLTRSTSRLGNDLVCTAIGDFAEGVPFSEWQHWQMYAVEPPSYETIDNLRAEKPIPQMINELVQELAQLNDSFCSFGRAFTSEQLVNPWQGSLESLAVRQLKWVYPANAGEDEFIKRATLASTLISDGLLPEPLRKLLCSIGPSLHLKKNESLGSRNLLQRLFLVAAIVVKVRPPLTELPVLVEQAEKSTSPNADQDLQRELSLINSDVRMEFSPLAYLYDLRNHGGMAHKPSKAGVAIAAQNLGLSSEAWGRQDFIKLITQIAGSLERVSHRLSAASMVARGLV